MAAKSTGKPKAKAAVKPGPVKRPAGPASSTTLIKGGAGEKPVKIQKGGLHKSLGVPEGQNIPAAKMAAAKAGKFGPLAAKQANLATGMLAAGRKTAARNRGKKSS